MLKVHAMARTTLEDPLLKYNYTVSIAGLPSSLGFNKVTGLKRELTAIEYAEGGYKHTLKLQGKEKVEDVVLERGVYSGSNDLYDQYVKTFNNPDNRTTITISLLDKEGNPQRTWILGEAWFKMWEGPEMEGTSEEVAIEKITICFEYFVE